VRQTRKKRGKWKALIQHHDRSSPGEEEWIKELDVEASIGYFYKPGLSVAKSAVLKY